MKNCGLRQAFAATEMVGYLKVTLFDFLIVNLVHVWIAGSRRHSCSQLNASAFTPLGSNTSSTTSNSFARRSLVTVTVRSYNVKIQCHVVIVIVIVNSTFLQRPQKRSRGNQLIHRILFKTKSISSGSDSERQAGRQANSLAKPHAREQLF